MKKLVLVTAVIMAMAAPASATNIWGGNHKTTNEGGHGGDASASANQAQGQAQGQVQGQAQGQGQAQSNVNSINNSDSFTFNEAKIPRITGQVSMVFSSMANDRCGRVALGVPYSAHTCNVLMEAASLADMIQPVYGKAAAYKASMLHVASNDRTMRKTLIRMGIVRLVD